MEKSCKNCIWGNLLVDRCLSPKKPPESNCYNDGNYQFWEPNFETLKQKNITLKRENAELKSALKDIIYSCCSGRVGHIGNHSVYTLQIDCKTIDNLMGLIAEGVAK